MLYNLGIHGMSWLFRLLSPFHAKAKKAVQGRKGLIRKIAQAVEGDNAPVVWMHCASVGEFEQGRPVLEKIRGEYPRYRIILTFFSPSGYELRKNYAGADFVWYLPWDTRHNAERFVSAINPSLAIFVKYEFWFHYSDALWKRKIPLISVSTIFRPDQAFFKSYGKLYREILRRFSFFFVQNDESLKLLKSIGIQDCSIAGDTRFDRVKEIVDRREPVPTAESFKANDKLLVVGSCWPEDLEVLLPLINDQRLKVIIAPHEISESFLEQIERSLTVKSIRYSAAEGVDLGNYVVLIIDNVGLLSRLYQYGEFAYVGGAFGKGLHNILEAACYGIPVFFGNRNYKKFKEARDLINLGGAFEVGSYTDLRAKYEMLNEPENFMLAAEVTRQYIDHNLGATERIMDYCRKIL
jgi:3-deoxy-D-manno-octulosonic-acid transferase